MQLSKVGVLKMQLQGSLLLPKTVWCLFSASSVILMSSPSVSGIHFHNVVLSKQKLN